MFFIMLSTIEDEHERLKISDMYTKYRHTCLHFAMSITHNRQMAEDAVQDAFIEVIKRKDKYLQMGCSDLLPSIVIIVKHRALNILKKQSRQSDTPIEDLEDSLESPEIAIDEHIIGEAGFERLVALIAGLNQNYRLVLEMKYIQYLSNSEIAKALNISAKNVEMRLYRAKAKLREQLGNEVSINV